ncbi:MAG TPA: PQQ-dependent sugar dehydrogenase [Gaiellaceae bacterium]|nr:PQQ-dependent sugar dehydrogenase [Gaiellaceae bacterium]
MRLALALLVLVVGALAACGANEEGTAPASSEGAREQPPSPPRTRPAPVQDESELRLRLRRVASGFASPTHVAATPSEPNRLYVVEQPGRIRVIVRGRVRTTPFLDIRDQVSSGGEQGLFAVAFHPRYERNRKVYVHYTDRNGDTRVVQYRSNGRRVRERTRRRLLFVDQPYANHNGGQLAFGPGGRLYVGLGDGGSAGDPQNRAQRLSTKLGKILRRNVDRPRSRWRIVGYGLRNPWRFSFDRRTGDLYVGDVGQAAWEEVSFTRRRSRGLENYGWDVYEGRAVYENKRPNRAGRLVRPIVVYPLGGGTCAVTGGFVYRGSRMSALRGRYFYGDYCSGAVWSFRVSGGRAVRHRREPFTVPLLSSFGESARGELYLASHNGTIYRLGSS